MNKKLVTIGIFVILICVGLSGCNESKKEEDKSDKSIYTVIEAVAQVVNGTGEPVGGVSVTFRFLHADVTLREENQWTDSTGWTGFAVHSLSIEKDAWAGVSVFVTQNLSIYENFEVKYSEAKGKTVNGVYYWSVSARLVQN